MFINNFNKESIAACILEYFPCFLNSYCHITAKNPGTWKGKLAVVD